MRLRLGLQLVVNRPLGIATFLFGLSGCFGEAPSIDAPTSSATEMVDTSSVGTSSVGTSSPGTTLADSTESSTGAMSTEGAGSSTSGAPDCSTDAIEPGDGWSDWMLVRIGIAGEPPPECPDGVSQVEVLLPTTETVECGCDCGPHAQQCSLSLLSSPGGCGVSVTETDLLAAQCVSDFADPNPALYQDISFLAPGGECSGQGVPVADELPPWTVCVLPDAVECNAMQRVCVMADEPAAMCPLGTVPLPEAQHVECAACSCSMSEWCGAARVWLFTDTMCETPASPGEVVAGRGCQQNGAFASAMAGDTRLGCMTPAQATAPRTVCCVP